MVALLDKALSKPTLPPTVTDYPAGIFGSFSPDVWLRLIHKFVDSFSLHYHRLLLYVSLSPSAFAFISPCDITPTFPFISIPQTNRIIMSSLLSLPSRALEQTFTSPEPSLITWSSLCDSGLLSISLLMCYHICTGKAWLCSWFSEQTHCLHTALQGACWTLPPAGEFNVFPVNVCLAQTCPHLSLQFFPVFQRLAFPLTWAFFCFKCPPFFLLIYKLSISHSYGFGCLRSNGSHTF